MWLIFNSIDYQDDFVSKTGKKYGAFVLKGEKKGFDGKPNEPYEKKFFSSSATTIIEGGIERPNCSIVQFFQKAVNPGDTVIIKNVRRSNGWEIESIKKLGEDKVDPTYEPLTDEEKQRLRNAPQAIPTAGSEQSFTPPWVR